MVFSRNNPAGRINSRFRAGIFTGALIIRLSYSFLGGRGERDPDEEVYLSIARHFRRGEGLIYTPLRRASFPPLYPLFLAGFLRRGGEGIALVRAAQALLGAFSCLLLMGIYHRIRKGDGSGELITGALMAIYPFFIIYGSLLMTETLFIFLLWGGVYCLLRGLEDSGWLAGAGILMGLSSLCRPTALPLVILVPFWFLLLDHGRKEVLRRGLYFFIPVILVLIPWEARNYRLFHRWVPVTTRGGSNLYLANNPLSRGGTVGISELIAAGIYREGDHVDEIEYNRYYGRAALKFIAADPGRFLRLSVRRLLWFYHLDRHNRNWVLVFSFRILLALALAGAWISRSAWRKTALLGLIVADFTLIHMVFLPEGRYRLALVPALLIFAAVSLSRLVPAARQMLFTANSRSS